MSVLGHGADIQREGAHDPKGPQRAVVHKITTGVVALLRPMVMLETRTRDLADTDHSRRSATVGPRCRVRLPTPCALHRLAEPQFEPLQRMGCRQDAGWDRSKRTEHPSPQPTPERVDTEIAGRPGERHAPIPDQLHRL